MGVGASFTVIREAHHDPHPLPLPTRGRGSHITFADLSHVGADERAAFPAAYDMAGTMAMRFKRIAEREVEPTRVTLRVYRGEAAAILGRVSTLAYGESGAVELMSTEAADPPIETALKLAVELATFKEQDVDVVDAEGLWQAAWGEIS